MKDCIAVFISSKQVEFEMERAVLADKIRAVPFLEPVVAEEWPPERRTIREVFLDRVRRSHIYVGLFDRVYSEPTELEYRTAVENPYREVLLYVKRCPDADREPPLTRFIQDLKRRHTIMEYSTIADLLPVFQDHLRACLIRMITHLQKLGESAPEVRASDAVLQARWMRQREQLLSLGLPQESDRAADWVLRVSEATAALTRR
jgi:Domain of unknown function (DUF4062)